MLRAGVANKYTCGLITQDDGNEDIFYMTRGEAGLEKSASSSICFPESCPCCVLTCDAALRQRVEWRVARACGGQQGRVPC